MLVNAPMRQTAALAILSLAGMSVAAQEPPDIGFVRFRMTTRNQNDEVVQTGICNLVVPRRR